MTDYQGKAKKKLNILSSLHQTPPLLTMTKRPKKVSKLTMTQNMMLILWVK